MLSRRALTDAQKAKHQSANHGNMLVKLEGFGISGMAKTLSHVQNSRGARMYAAATNRHRATTAFPNLPIKPPFKKLSSEDFAALSFLFKIRKRRYPSLHLKMFSNAPAVSSGAARAP